MKNDEITNLLWTGGWDSTFRLLYLLLVKEDTVQPYYIIDSDRPSTGLELRTMKDIKQRLFSEHPRIKELLLPTQYKEMNDIQPNKEITQCYERLLEEYLIGTQYDWLARFAREEGIKNLEMSIAYKDGRVYLVLEKFAVRCGVEEDSYFEIDRQYEGSDVFEVFKYFRLPILSISKVDMVTVSRTEGFYDLMVLTWFCHRPRANGTPCGTCNPCICAMEEGMGWRLPFISRVRYHLRLSVKLRRVLQKFPRLYSFARSIKHKIHSS